MSATMIKGDHEVYLTKVTLKELFLNPKQGIDLKHAQTLKIELQKRGGYFPPLHCHKIGDRYMVKEGHHRYIAYLASAYADCWITYEVTVGDKI